MSCRVRGAEPLYVFDLSGLVYRHYKTVPAMSGRSAFAVIEGIVQQKSPALFALAEDTGFENFRHELMRGWGLKYKAHRNEDEKAAVLDQIRICGEMAEDILGVRRFSVAGYEGDDVVAALVERASQEARNSIIVGWDKDFWQLVRDEPPRVRLWDGKADPRKEQDCVERFGVRPAQMVDYLCMVGDSSDGVPGVWGCGPKAAEGVLGAFETLEEAFASAAEGRESHPFWKANGKVWSRLGGDVPRVAADRARQLIRLRPPSLELGPLHELLVEAV